MNKKIVILILLLAFALNGCMTQEQPLDDESQILTVSSGNEIIERSEKLSDITVELYGIDDVTTIIVEDKALMGVRLAYDNELTDDIKESISSVVLSSDTLIKDVLITDNSTLFSEINSIVIDIFQGQSYDGQLNRIKKVENKIK